ncbi:MAG: hypothetical protein V4693_03050 [Pseudomonadota bacterium]
MKRLLFSLLLGALSLSAHAAPASAATIALPATPHIMFPQDWDVYAGKYSLSSGDTMTLRRRGLRMYAEFANRPPVQLVAAAGNVFVAVDRSPKMTLADEGAGDMSAEIVMAAPARR